MKMTNEVLIALVADAAKVSRNDTAKVIKSLSQVVGALMNEGCSVEIVDFGEFETVTKRQFSFYTADNLPLPVLPK